MAAPSSTFSESWHRVAGQKICLRPGVQVHRHRFRGERWMVLQNPLSNQFFRLRPEAYAFVARLTPERTVEQVWQECLEKFPETAPGQEQIVQLLAQLYHANLLYYEAAPDTSELFERYKKRQQQEMGFRWLNIMFMRFPLLDPDRFLTRTLPFLGKLISPVGALIWLVMVGWGLKVVADNFPALSDQTQGVLAPDNLLWLYVGLVILKTLHEFGHAYFCRHYGGEVHTMGVMLMIFTPVPYVDATSSWAFKSKRQRVMVGLAGMIVELFVAAVAAVVWANTAKGEIIHSVAFNMMFIASVSTLLFNINPLMRFDGYYIMSDLLELANLNTRAMGQLKHLCEKHLFGVKQTESPAHTKREAWLLGVYGISAMVYRTIVFAGIIWFVADKWLIVGFLMAVICLVTWLVVPTVKLVKYLATEPKLARTRARAVAVVCGGAAGILAFLTFVPLPHHFRASGVVQAKSWGQVIPEASGEVVEILARPGHPVRAGQPLLRMDNPELGPQLAEARATAQEVEIRWRAALQGDAASLKPLQSRRESALKLIERLEKEQESLVVRARHNGIWIAPGVEDLRRRWMARGTALGLIVDPASFEFSATVLQADVDRIFKQQFPAAQVRLFGEADEVIQIKDLQVVPGEQRTLPTPALGWQGGGDVAVSMEDQQGRTAAEPFFAVIGQITPVESVALLHGRTGKVRFKLPNEPLLPRWIRRLGQLLQKKFQF
jgi:putative peptide zinc metalloprotease protein